MNAIRQIMAATIVGLIFPAWASADPVTITFENPPCAMLSAGSFPSTCYLADGLLLSSTSGHGATDAFSIRSSTEAVSPPNVAAGFPQFPDLKGEFFLSSGNFGYTDSLSLNMTGAVQGQDPWEVLIFGGPTGLQFLGGVRGGDTNQLLTFRTSVPSIHMFRVFNGVPSNGIDNLTFSSPSAAAAATPEPASVLLFLSGFSAALVRRRRNLPKV